MVTYRDGLPAHRWSPIQALTRQHTAGASTHNPLITSLTLHYQDIESWFRHSLILAAYFDSIYW